jgi:sugar/nucleoside kinase (ribokinase family)
VVIAVVGDTTLDVAVRPDGPMRTGGDVRAEIVLGVGGQGANIAVRLARRGPAVRLITALAADAGSDLIQSRLAAEQLELAALPAERTSVVVALLDEKGERTMLSDRAGMRGDLLPLLADAAWIHVSGYVLRDAPEAAGVLAAIRALAARPRLSVAGGSVLDGADADVFREAISVLSPDLLLLSRDEASAVLDGAPPSLAATAVDLAVPGRLAIVTGGAEGSAAAAPWLDVALSVAPQPIDPPPTDATGAGDAYLAGLIDALLECPWPPDASTIRGAMERASELGARVARVTGAQGHVDGERESSAAIQDPAHAR